MTQGVHHEVLDDPLDLRRIELDQRRLRVDVHVAPLGDTRLGDNHPHQICHIRRHPSRLDDALRQPVEVQEVRNEPGQLASVRLQPAGEVVNVLIGQTQPLSLSERDRASEDRRQWGSELVGDGRQERVLHLIRLPEVLGRLTLELCLLAQLARRPRHDREQHGVQDG